MAVRADKPRIQTFWLECPLAEGTESGLQALAERAREWAERNHNPGDRLRFKLSIEKEEAK